MTTRPRYQPMLAATAPAPFSDDNWLFEIKWDGVRAIATIGTTVSLRSRNNKELAGHFPELSELMVLAPGTVLDGEIVVMMNGKPDMQALLPRLLKTTPTVSAPPVTYIVFDILRLGDNDLTGLPLIKRRRILTSAVHEGAHVIISVPIEGKGEDYYRAAVAQGLEGVMAKRKDSLYEPGVRSGAWLKIRAFKTCDCVIVGFTPGQGRRSSAFGALLLGLYDENTLVSVGKAGTGFSDRLLAELMKDFSPLITVVPQIKDIRETVTWLEPVLVCEVGYMEVTRENKLRLPRFLRLRTDKPAVSCTIDQLAGVKPVHEAIKTTAARRSAAETKPTLRIYHERRNFSVTKEPVGAPYMSQKTFVVQEHHSHKLHFDLRLERDGVLKSWAVPKGIPEVMGEKHLAVAVEDHPLDYQKFEGEIPKGEYGAGTVSIWDSGTYDTKHWDEEKIEVTLHGKRLNGAYVLVKFKRAGQNDWLLFRTA
jgi:DNA ligase D-like protein (predicted ligase)/DNA ligase D-like protein (predicted 3'-phosphoesterase)